MKHRWMDRFEHPPGSGWVVYVDWETEVRSASDGDDCPIGWWNPDQGIPLSVWLGEVARLWERRKAEG